MKKTTLAAAVILTGALTVGAFAHQNSTPNQGMVGNQQGMMGNQQGMGMMNGQQKMMGSQQGMMGGGMMGGQGGMGMMSGMMGGGMQMFSQLNLTSDQQFKLSILKDEMQIEMKKFMFENHKQGNMGTFLKGDSFDKDTFKKHMNEKHNNMLDLRANHMEKVFKILTKEQVTELKKNLTK